MLEEEMLDKLSDQILDSINQDIYDTSVAYGVNTSGVTSSPVNFADMQAMFDRVMAERKKLDGRIGVFVGPYEAFQSGMATAFGSDWEDRLDYLNIEWIYQYGVGLVGSRRDIERYLNPTWTDMPYPPIGPMRMA